ncbi:MAG TPA: class I SAM-dependent methyltransferase, partial [Polyangium sp.]|nr:class I SAM-dependent methyltransferase [Polyangium sp.]
MASPDREPLSTRVVRALSRGPRIVPQRFEAPEVYGREAIARIARSLPPVERIYANIRFSILRPKLLSVMDLLLPDEGRILDIGCGFGLFAAYFGQTQPERRIVGVDPDAKRIAIARRVSEAVGLQGHSFIAGDARDVALKGPFSAAYVLDVMHHIPSKDQLPMLERLRDLLAPRGVLVVKDITT